MKNGNELQERTQNVSVFLCLKIRESGCEQEIRKHYRAEKKYGFQRKNEDSCRKMLKEKE